MELTDLQLPIMEAKRMSDFEFLENATETLRAMAHPQRLQIVQMLHSHSSMNVTDIHTQLDIEQAVASHHLRIMKDKGIVQVKRDGKNSVYSLTDEKYYQVLALLSSML